ncbi:MAG TPA: glycosyltransferase [Opitutus sp.]|nr:glycosyltransferase [Opitutus sp.]
MTITDFSVAIPAFNEAVLLPRLLRSIEVARGRYRGGREAIEVIVGNNGSTDATATLARESGARVVDIATRCIGAARNGAGRAARGRILCFVDADSIVHPETFNEIRDVADRPDWTVGATGLKMERMSFAIRVTMIVAIPVARLFDVESGVVFCRRADFEAVGGYREDVLAGEDVDFLYRLKRLGRTRRSGRLARVPTARTITSTRKFDRYGDWHFLRMMVTMPFTYLLWRKRADRFIWRHWYADRE